MKPTALNLENYLKKVGISVKCISQNNIEGTIRFMRNFSVLFNFCQFSHDNQKQIGIRKF